MPALRTVLLTASNVFMTFAWYGHLKHLGHRAWHVAALCLMGAVYFTFRGQGGTG